MARDSRYFALASRVCAENGASIVKTYYCDGFEKVAAACPVPVVIAGGKKLPEKEALELCYNAVNDGAAGVDMGRNVFQSRKPCRHDSGRTRCRTRRLDTGTRFRNVQGFTIMC